MKVFTKQITATDEITGNKVKFDVVLHKNDDGSWYGYAVQPPFGIDMKVEDSGASSQEVLETIRELLTRVVRTTPNIEAAQT